MKKWVILAIVVAQIAGAQDRLAAMISEGKVKMTMGDHEWNGKLMLEGKSLFEKASAIDPNSGWAIYWLGYANYRLAIYSIYGQDTDDTDGKKLSDAVEVTVKQYIEDAVAILEKATIADPQLADGFALLGSLTGMRIAFNPLSAMWLGPRSQKYFSKAMEIDSKNPRVFYLKGIGIMNTPGMFGGGADKSIPEFDKAIVLFEEERHNPPANVILPTWGLEECYSFRGNALEQMNMTEKAKESYKKALEINPNSKRAKGELARLEKKN